MNFGSITMIGVRGDVPVDPVAPVARDWLIEELSKPAYQAAKPTWFDILTTAFWDWINSLEFGDATGPPAFGLAVVTVLIVAALVVAFLIFGVPRLNRRSAVTETLFGDDDDRDAAAMRRDALQAAARGDHSTAVAEMFRAIARGLAERTIVMTNPGTTARDFSIKAATAFPGFATSLAIAAAAFDDVRYLGRYADQEQFNQIASLERELRVARAALEPAAVGSARA